MKKLNKNELENLILAGIGRFIGEMAPFWSEEDFMKLINPNNYEHQISDSVVQDTLNSLKEKNLIYLLKNKECYFIISETLVVKYYSGEFRNILVAEIKNLRVKYNI